MDHEKIIDAFINIILLLCIALALFEVLYAS
jgi:hypothetical protein